MGRREPLLVRVNDDLVLDAGICEYVAGGDGVDRVVRPPQTPLFQQVLEYLRAKPDPKRRSRGSAIGREGVAAAAVTVRWGSYFAVLADRSKPVWDAAQAPRRSRISDEEMARINIEASAAMAQWVDLYRTAPDAYTRLVERAAAYLSMPVRSASPNSPWPFLDLSDADHARRLEDATAAVLGVDHVARARDEVARHPTRLFANAAVNVAWRNGPVEDVHAGWPPDYPLDRRRITPDEEAELMRFASDGMALVMRVCKRFARERPPRPWTEQVLPYALAKKMPVTPKGWTLTETSREVRFYRVTGAPPTAP